MNHKTEKKETNREQLSRLAQALSAGRNADLADDLAAGSTVAMVGLFTADNLAKRREKIERQVEFVAEAVDGLGALVEAYIHAMPLAAYDTGASDAERFLEWLEKTERLTPEQNDCVACQRARFAVEDAARWNRGAHARFQELLSTAETLACELETNHTLGVHLNPIRVWSRFETAELLDDSASLPAEVIFYPVEGDIRTAVLEGAGLERIRELVSFGPCTIDEWLEQLEPFAGLASITRNELVVLCRELVAMGLVALS